MAGYKAAEKTVSFNPKLIYPFLMDRQASKQWVFYNGHTLKEFSPTTFLLEPNSTLPLSMFFNNSLTTLNHPFHPNGASLVLPKKSVIRDPLYIVHVIDADAMPLMGHPKNTILVQENCHATLIEIVVNCGKQSASTNTLTHIKLENKATLSHLFLQRSHAHSPSTQMAHIHIEQAKDSCYRGTAITLGGSLNRANFQIDLNAPNAECEFQALEFANERTQMELQLIINHHQPHSESRILTRGVIKDNAKANFTGKIVVHKNAHNTIASLENKNILLSRQASVTTRPELEIYNHDIQCSHGATVGHLDLDALFYLQSRGISKEAAEKLLMNSFMAPALEGLLPDTRHYIEALIHAY